MEIFSTKLIKFALVETSIGEFKIEKTGTFTRWSRNENEHVPIEHSNFKEEQLYEIFRAGNEILFGVVPGSIETESIPYASSR